MNEWNFKSHLSLGMHCLECISHRKGVSMLFILFYLFLSGLWYRISLNAMHKYLNSTNKLFLLSFILQAINIQCFIQFHIFQHKLISLLCKQISHVRIYVNRQHQHLWFIIIAKHWHSLKPFVFLLLFLIFCPLFWFYTSMLIILWDAFLFQAETRNIIINFKIAECKSRNH